MPRPTRRAVLQGATALASVGCHPSTEPGPEPADTGRTGQAPILYIYVDQLRYDALGCSGNPVVRSPVLDALAAESVRFERCVTNAPSCRASRASMMTGLHVFAHGVWDNHVLPDPALQSHVRRLRDAAGYRTVVVGKTHLHDGFGHLDDHVDRLRRWGFSDAVELPDPQQHDLHSAHSDWLSATTPAGQIDKHRRWADYILGYTWDAPPPDLPPWSLSTADHLDSFCARTAAQVILDHDPRRPLYLQVNFPGPHKPFDPTSEFLPDRDDPAMPLPIPGPPAPPHGPLNELYQGIKLEPWLEPEARILRAAYYGKIALVDRGIGLVLDALREAGLYDDAWIVVHSDHGELLGDHGMTGKVLGYEGAIRVPLLIKPPGGLSHPWVDRGQVDGMDVTATLLAVGGLDPTGFGDRDLSARVLGGPGGPLAHQGKPVMFENLGHVGLRTDTLKLGWDLALGRPVELFELSSDPQELHNRIEDPSLAADLDELVALLRERRPLPVDRFR